MTYLAFKENLRNLIVFNLNDIRKIDAVFDLRRLSEWQDKGYIKMVRRGHYVFADLTINEENLFLIANKIYSPSYISMEMALSYYNLIPEAVYGITSVSTRKTNDFRTELGEFSYRHIKPALMFGYKLISHKDYNIKVAEMEKAILDFFYINPHLEKENDFAGLRFNSDEFDAQADKNKIKNYLAAFSNKKLEKRFNIFLKYINND
jgi:predicted transcriptional regulator of viral defense system